MEFLPEMGATTVLNEQIQVRSKQKSGQPSKNSGQPEKKTQVRKDSAFSHVFKNSGMKSPIIGIFGIILHLLQKI